LSRPLLYYALNPNYQHLTPNITLGQLDIILPIFQVHLDAMLSITNNVLSMMENPETTATKKEEDSQSRGKRSNQKISTGQEG
jgi:hypothetical protein